MSAPSTSPPSVLPHAPQAHPRPAAPARAPGRLDVVGVAVSCLCACHCVGLPLVALALPVAGGGRWRGSESLEWVFLAASVAIGIGALGRGVLRTHGRWRPALAFAVGLTLVVLGRGVEGEPVMGVGHAGYAMVIAGALAIVAAHLDNRRLSRSASDAFGGACCCPPEAHGAALPSSEACTTRPR